MKRMSWTVVAALCAVRGFAWVAESTLIKWEPNVVTGYYNEASSWIGDILPNNGTNGAYGWIQPYAGSDFRDLVVKIPAGGLEENSGLYYASATPTTSGSITFDTRGTYWKKTAAYYEAGHSAFTYYDGTRFGNHIFNIENVDFKDGAYPVFLMSNAVLRISSEQGRHKACLEQGTWQLFNDGRADRNRLYLGSGAPIDFHLTSNGTFDGNISIRGNSLTHLLIEGGRHRIINLEVCDNNSNGNPSYLVVSGEAAPYIYSLAVGNKSDSNKLGKSKGYVTFSNNVEITGHDLRLGAGSQSYVNICNVGFLSMYDHARYTLSDCAYVGYTQCSTGVLEMADHSYMRVTNNFIFGCVSNAYGVATIKDDAELMVNANIFMGDKLESKAEFHVQDRAQVSCHALYFANAAHADITGTLNVAGSARLNVSTMITNRTTAGAVAEISIHDQAVLTTPKIFGQNATALAVDGGTIVIPADVTGATIGGLTSATLGSGGLAVKANSDVAIDAAWTGTGTLTLDGPGKTIALTGASGHARTVVTPATTVVVGDATQVGKALTLQNNAILELPANATVTLEKLSVPGKAIVNLDAGAKLEVTDENGLDIAGTLGLVVRDSLEVGQACSVMKVSEGTTIDVGRFFVMNISEGKAYNLKVDGTELKVEAVSSEGGQTCTWTGAAGNDWNTPANWSPQSVPTVADDVVIDKAAEITVSGNTGVKSFTITAAGNVSITGDRVVVVTGAEALNVNAGANMTLAAPLVVGPNVVANILAGATVTVAGALFNGGEGPTTFTKVGSGALEIAGDNATLDVDWILPRGTTTFRGPTAFGLDTTSENGLVLSNNLVRYEGDAAVIRRPLKFLGEFPAWIENEGDLTLREFTIKNMQKDSGLVKTGVGRLTFALPLGETILTTFASTNLNRHGNCDGNAWGSFTPNAYGEIENWNGICQLNILEGTLNVTGKGRDKSTLKQIYHTLIGGAKYFAKKTPELRAENVRLETGSSKGFHTRVGRNVVADSAEPLITLINATYFENGVYLVDTAEGTPSSCSTFAATNSIIYSDWAFYAPENGKDKVSAPRILIDNCVFEHWIVDLGANCHVDIRNTTITPRDNRKGQPTLVWALLANGGACFNFENTSLRSLTLSLLHHGDNADAVSPVVNGLTLNYFRMDTTDATAAARPEKDSFTIGEKGLTLKVEKDITHKFAVPLKGAGVLTKIGPGLCILRSSLRATGRTTYVDDSRFPVLLNEGGLRVAEGEAVIQEGAATNTCPVEVCAGAGLSLDGATMTLGELAGPGVISNGTLSATLPTANGGVLPTFSDVVFGEMRVDCGIPEGEKRPDIGTTYTVAHFASDLTALSGRWTGVNVGEGGKLTFKLNDAGDVVATVESTSGMVFILR